MNRKPKENRPPAIFLILLGTMLFSGSAVAEETRHLTVSSAAETVCVRADGARLELGQKNVLAGSEKLTVLEPGAAELPVYELNYDTGTVTFAGTPVGSCMVVLSYLFLPFSLPESYGHVVRVDSISSPTQTAAVLPSSAPRFPSMPSGLAIAGSKTFSA